MDDLPKKRRDTSRFTRERGTMQALRAVGPAIAGCNARLAHCRAVATLSKPGYATAIMEECQGLRAAVSDLRKQLSQIVAGLSEDQRGNSRVRDTRLALDKLEIGIEGILELVAADPRNGLQLDGLAASSAAFMEGGKDRDRQGSTPS